VNASKSGLIPEQRKIDDNEYREREKEKELSISNYL
jgi:hypothetical protein